MGSKIVKTKKYEYGWFNDLYGTKDITIKKLILLFQEKHKPIRKYFHSSKGSIIQNFDSHIASKVINFYTSEIHADEDGSPLEIPVLCVHDSFIIDAEYRTDLIMVMKNAMIEFINEQTGKPKKGVRTKSIKTKTTGIENTLLKRLEALKKYKQETKLYDRAIEQGPDVAKRCGFRIIDNQLYKRKEPTDRENKLNITPTPEFEKKLRPKLDQMKPTRTYLVNWSEFLLFKNQLKKNYYQ